MEHAGSESEIKTQGTWGKPCFTLCFPCLPGCSQHGDRNNFTGKKGNARELHTGNRFIPGSQSAPQTPQLGHGERSEWVMLGQEQTSSSCWSDLSSALEGGKAKGEKPGVLCSLPLSRWNGEAASHRGEDHSLLAEVWPHRLCEAPWEKLSRKVTVHKSQSREHCVPTSSSGASTG